MLSLAFSEYRNDFSLNGSRLRRLSALLRATVAPRSRRRLPGAKVRVTGLVDGGGATLFPIAWLRIRSKPAVMPRHENTSWSNEKISRTLRSLNLMLPQMPKCALIGLVVVV